MTTGVRKTGEFCWINMLTPQPADARAFFGKVLGWTYDELPGMGHIVNVGGRNIGGLWDLEGPNTPKGTPPLIGVMVKVDSADETARKAAALGGTSKPAFDIMENGRMAECVDPNGAAFDLWEPRKQPGTEVESTLHGAPSWFETMTTDVDRATTYYTELFGWTAEKTAMPGMTYTTFKLGDVPVAGMLGMPPEVGAMKPFWGTYFTVNNVDETVGIASSLGASIHVPAQDIPGVGRFSGVMSPQGVMFYVIRYAN